MISDDDPGPLDAPDTQAPDALVRALRALGREQPSSADLQATALRLEERLLGSQPAPPGAAVRASSRLPWTRLTLAALALGLGISALVLRQSPTPGPTTVSPSAPPAVPAARAPLAVAPATQPAESAAPAISRHEVARGKVAAAPTAGPRRPALSVMPKQPAPPARARSVASRVSAPRVATPSTSDGDGVAPTARASAVTDSAPSVQSPRPTIARTELELLFAARKLVRVDPAEALSLLAEHERRFAGGQLAPEREVLAIEALRALGRDRQAEQRLERFRAAYPGSVHNSGLTAPPR